MKYVRVEERITNEIQASDWVQGATLLAEIVADSPEGTAAEIDLVPIVQGGVLKKVPASQFAGEQSVPIKASGAELNTGTNDAKFATAKALADSDYAKTSDITAAAVGLGNASNTSDANKPISTATQDALNLKANASSVPNYKSQRVTTGEVGGGLSALVMLTWTAPFADANYTVIASVQDSTAGLLSLVVVHIESISASQVAVRVSNTTVATPITGTLHLIAIHD